MKKIWVTLLIVLIVIGFSTVYAAPLQEVNTLEEQTTSELVEMKTKNAEELQKYEELYGSKAYGFTAYILSKIQLFSIPACFLGIAVGSAYRYVLGIRRIDMQDKGLALLIGFVSILVVCQVLPLIFAVVVQGWRG